VLECVINIAEGRDRSVVGGIVEQAGSACVDHHSDAWHNRSVLTLVGPDVFDAAIEVTRATVEHCDFRAHEGVHPAIGVVDVVPFTPLGSNGFGSHLDLSEAEAVRDRFVTEVGKDLALPCFAYGPERSLPEIRRGAFRTLQPSNDLTAPHPTAGACCVGARPTLIAYNVYLDVNDVVLARTVAAAIRSGAVRSLGLEIGHEVQVSCNLVAPWLVGPADVMDMVAELAPVRRAELVGLIPDDVLRQVPRTRWTELDLGLDRTIEARLPA
jgi:glutamate formiminotransferase